MNGEVSKCLYNKEMLISYELALVKESDPYLVSFCQKLLICGICISIRTITGKASRWLMFIILSTKRLTNYSSQQP